MVRAATAFIASHSVTKSRSRLPCQRFTVAAKLSLTARRSAAVSEFRPIDNPLFSMAGLLILLEKFFAGVVAKCLRPAVIRLERFDLAVAGHVHDLEDVR